MGFVSPFLLWGGLAAVSAPILIHLLNRQKYKRIRWAAMEFLLLAFKRTRRRVQIEHLIILLLRCLTLLMLGMCLAQPLLGGFIVSGSRDVYVLVDDSYSMGYLGADDKTSFNRAQDALTNIVFGLKPKDNVRVVMLSDVMKSIYPDNPDTDRRRVEPVFQSLGESLTQQEIDQFMKDITKKLESSDFHTDMFAGLQYMQNVLYSGRYRDQPTKELYVITDFQLYSWGLGVGGRTVRDEEEEGAGGEKSPVHTTTAAASQEEFRELLDDLTEPHAGVEVKVFLIDAGDPEPKKENFIIEDIAVDQKELVTGSRTNFEVAVSNVGFEARKNVVVKLYVDGEPVGERTISTLEPGETGKVSFRKTFRETEEGAHWAQAVVEDNLTTDSTRYLGFRVRKGIKILIIDGDKKPDFKSESWVLQFALHPHPKDEIPSPTEKKLYIARPVIVDRLLKEKDPAHRYAEFDIVIMANVRITPATPTAAEIEMLETYVNNGGKLIIWLGDNVDGNEYNQRLFKRGEGLMPAELAPKPTGEKYSDIAESARTIRFFTGELNHPIMRIFLKTRVLEREDESPVFSRYFMMKVPPTNAVVARFDETNILSERYKKLPAIVLKRFPNDGRAILLNTTADREWSNMTVSPRDAIYLVLVHQIVIYLMGAERTDVPLGPPINRSYVLPSGSLASYMQAKGPGDDKPGPIREIETEDLSEQGKVIFHITVRDTFKAGPYMVQYFESGECKDYFTVNVNLAESDLSRIEPKRLQGIYPEFRIHRIIEPGQKVEAGGVNTSSNIWRIPLALMILFMALESGLALLFGRRTRT